MTKHKSKVKTNKVKVKNSTAENSGPTGVKMMYNQTYRHALSPVSAVNHNGTLRGDPFLPLNKVQFVYKSDLSTMVLVGSQITGQSTFSNSADSGAHPMRVSWVPPFVVQQPGASGKAGAIQGDIRGVFADIGLTKAVFKNVTKQPLKIIINSPRARISDPGNCYLRRYKKELEIAPGKTKIFTANWGDRANIFTPMVGVVGISGDADVDEKQQVFTLFDFMVVAPDIDEMSGKKLAELADQNFVEVRVMQKYVATASYQYKSMVVEKRDPILVTKLGRMLDMMEENPVVLKARLPVSPITCISVAGNHILHAGGRPCRNEDLEDRFVVVQGVSGYFKIMKGVFVLWDMNEDCPASQPLEPVSVAPGASYEVLAQQLTISVADIISWLTTVTEILTVVSSFV